MRYCALEKFHEIRLAGEMKLLVHCRDYIFRDIFLVPMSASSGPYKGLFSIQVPQIKILVFVLGKRCEAFRGKNPVKFPYFNRHDQLSISIPSIIPFS